VALIAVCGIPGAGKSTVYERLKAAGLDAWDTDRDGISGCRDLVTGAPAPDPVDWHDPAETKAIEYRVRRERVEELRLRASDHTGYLCGSAGGEDEFWDLLDRVIILDVDNETLRHRLATRTTNSYGKAAHELDGILTANVGWADAYAALGAIVIDGTRPIDEVVADVIRLAES
jgi:broad-specificity NMP kinase